MGKNNLVKNPVIEAVVEDIKVVIPVFEKLVKIDFKTDTNFQFMFDGKTLPDDQCYSREFKKADKLGEFKRPISPSYPNFTSCDKTQTVTFTIDEKEFYFTEEKFGNKSVCYLLIDNTNSCQYVSKKVIISIIADATTKSWNWVDQFLKSKLGLKTSQTASRRSSTQTLI